MKVPNPKQKDNIIARNETISIGLDVHHNNTEVVVLCPDEILHRQTMPTRREHFLALGARFENCRVRAVYEASSVGYKPLRWLREAGFAAYMTSPALIPTRHGEYVKNDRRDAVKLAHYDRAGLLKPVWDLSDQQYDDRQLVRSRKQLVQNRTRTCQQIKSILKFHSVEVAEGISTSWSNAFLEWLAAEPTGRPGIDGSLRPKVQMYRAFSDQIRQMTKQIKALTETERYQDRVDLLRTIPGVGVVTAMTFLVELGEVNRRFPSGEQLAGYLRLAPGEQSSANKQRKGSTPPGGNPWVRTALVQSSWQLIAEDEQLRAVYDRIKVKNPQYGAGIAIVAVARRLALAMRAMLREGLAWREEPVEEDSE